MVEYYPIWSTNHNLPHPEPEEEQAAPQPEVAIAWNVYQENADAKRMALRISLRLPVKF
jgi:hypothetical protein